MSDSCAYGSGLRRPAFSLFSIYYWYEPAEISPGGPLLRERAQNPSSSPMGSPACSPSFPPTTSITDYIEVWKKNRPPGEPDITMGPGPAGIRGLNPILRRLGTPRMDYAHRPHPFAVSSFDFLRGTAICRANKLAHFYPYVGEPGRCERAAVESSLQRTQLAVVEIFNSYRKFICVRRTPSGHEFPRHWHRDTSNYADKTAGFLTRNATLEKGI